MGPEPLVEVVDDLQALRLLLYSSSPSVLAPEVPWVGSWKVHCSGSPQMDQMVQMIM